MTVALEWPDGRPVGFIVKDLPCPRCGLFSLIGIYYINLANGAHQHTRYRCMSWPYPRGRCDWDGWTVPGWDDSATVSDNAHTDPRKDPMPPTVKITHEVAISGPTLTLTDLEELVAAARQAGAKGPERVQVHHYDNQRDGTSSTLTVVIGGA